MTKTGIVIHISNINEESKFLTLYLRRKSSNILMCKKGHGYREDGRVNACDFILTYASSYTNTNQSG